MPASRLQRRLMAPASTARRLLAALLLSAACLGRTAAFPPPHPAQHAPPKSPQPAEAQTAALGAPAALNTVGVACRPDSMEIIIAADMFGVGAPVDGAELRLGVEHDDLCRAAATSGDEYRIVVGLLDCGTKYWMTEDALVYTNLLIYAPAASPDGVIRMEEAVVPIECHYQRRYSLSSSPLAPTWIPYTSTQAAVETLNFDLRLMTPDWAYARSSNVFHLGEPISVEASVRVGHHMRLRVFASSCVATLQPDALSTPRYAFVQHGCLVDSQLPGSKSHFLPRTQDDKLHMVIDAFRFQNEDSGELYITCHLNAVPADDAEAPDKACTLLNGRWRSADGNDYLCGYCRGRGQAGHAHRKSGLAGRPDEAAPRWRSALGDPGWEQRASVGPVLVLPGRQKGRPLPDDQLPPPLLHQVGRPVLYSSQWKSGINYKKDLEKGLLPGPRTSDQVKDLTFPSENYDDDNDSDVDLSESEAELKEEDEAAAAAEVDPAESPGNSTAPLDAAGPTSRPLETMTTTLANVTVAEADVASTNDPKR